MVELRLIISEALDKELQDFSTANEIRKSHAAKMFIKQRLREENARV